MGPVESNDDTVLFVLQLAALPVFIQSSLGGEIFRPDGAQTRLLVTHCSRVLTLTQIPGVTYMELIFISCSKSLSFGFQKYPHSQVLQLMMMSAELNLIICTDCSLRFYHILMVDTVVSHCILAESLEKQQVLRQPNPLRCLKWDDLVIYISSEKRQMALEWQEYVCR